MGAKPPRAVDLTFVAALSLGLILDASHLDVYFGRVILDVLMPGHFRLAILTRFDPEYFTFSTTTISVNISFENFVKYLKNWRVLALVH